MSDGRTQANYGVPRQARVECWAPRLDGERLTDEYDPHCDTETDALEDGRELAENSDDRKPRLVTAEQVGPCYELRCSECYEPLTDPETGGWLHFSDPNEVVTFAQDNGWRLVAGLWRCEDSARSSAGGSS